MIADLTGKIAIVTGGAQGIGAGICSVLDQQGAIVVVADKNEDAAMYTSQQLSNKQSSHLGGDVTDDKSVLMNGGLGNVGMMKTGKPLLM